MLTIGSPSGGAGQQLGLTKLGCTDENPSVVHPYEHRTVIKK
jgi:hypothetical protein